MEFIASFSFLYCQFLPLLTGDPPPPPFASFNLHSFYELPLPIAPPSPVSPCMLLSSPVVLLSLVFPLTPYSATPSFPVVSLGGECAGIQTAKPVRMSLGRHFPSSLWQ